MEPLALYFDRNIGTRLPDALKHLNLPQAGNRIFHQHMERRLVPGLRARSGVKLFDHAEGDDKWLQFVGQRQWIVFSQDRKFHIPGFEHEMLAIKQFNVGCFYLWGANARTHEKALVFLKAYDRILKAIETTPRPFIYDITKSGKLEKIPIT